jgi:hypothetical protein
MAEPQLEGDNDAYLIFTTLWAGPNALFSFFLQLLLFPYSIGFLLLMLEGDNDAYLTL